VGASDEAFSEHGIELSGGEKKIERTSVKLVWGSADVIMWSAALRMQAYTSDGLSDAAWA